MATVHFGRLLGPVGFRRTVAIKRLHAQFAGSQEFARMFVDEARLASRVRHPNVVSTLDVVSVTGELFLVMDYVPGETLARACTACGADTYEPVPPAIASAIVAGVLHGLAAAHDARSERGAPLGLVHRDVSPQNILVGEDGVARVLDFGIAKATGRLQVTREGQVKGKLAYMAPEQVTGKEVGQACDLYAASVVLWELLSGRRLFVADNEGALLERVLLGFVEPPSRYAPAVSAELDALVLRGVSTRPGLRFASATEMALALEACAAPASSSAVSAWLRRVAGDALATRASVVQAIEIHPLDAIDNQTPSTKIGGYRAAGHAPLADHEVAELATSASAIPGLRRLRRPSAGRVGWIVAALALVLAFGQELRRFRGDTAGGPDAPPKPPAAPPIVSARPTDLAPTPRTNEGSLAASSAASAGSAPPTASAAPRAKNSRPAPTAIRPKASGADCAVPYTVDSSGQKSYKRECL